MVRPVELKGGLAEVMRVYKDIYFKLTSLKTRGNQQTFRSEKLQISFL